ncbi:uncharacterized protein C8Q71DRAFT_888993 [Rhodofomes roseus]|uniref:FAD-binding PCMH-type domain-containing protein n=1 Tax=Rhodofomes roseus TaxID=34475 RepID=A0ABQ8KQC1_9APHY|nr:uncharacterized protein C8Q71DRAFT_888993 [Rhodofomes roseus]KAH9840539.1 hypothetical protein C8Q71DRAFT_888993 [Rhodofomes roseus]
MMRQLLTFSLFALCTIKSALGDTPSLQSILGNNSIEVYFPGEPGYQNVSQAFNLRLHFEPIAVAYPNTTEQVAELVKAGAFLQVPVTARSGGHSYAAYGLGGANGHLVIDLANINEISVDNSTGVATVGTGNRIGDIAIALFDQAGRALPHGTCSLIGIGGHASFGGYGFTSRQWGLTLDNVIGATVVLANGTVVEASETQNPDLFWAVRGAAPSFGIVTHFNFTTYVAPAQPTFFSYYWSLPLEQAISGISLYQNFSFSPSIPPEIGFEMDLTKGTNNGEILLNLVGSYYGSPDQYSAIVQPFLDAMPNQTAPAQVNVTSWLDNLVLLAGGPIASTPQSRASENNTFYAKSLTTPSDQPMSEEAITALASWMSVEGWYTPTDWFVQLELYGGNTSKIDTIPSNATAYFNRHDLWTIQFYTSSADAEPPFPREGFAFLDGLVASITANEPESYAYGAYPNYVDPRLPPDAWHTLYFGSNFDRLRQIKTELDPYGVFTFPQSIPPYEPLL